MDLATFDPSKASPSDAVCAQKLLAAAGYYKGSIDGQFYAQSKAALRDWLAAQNKPTTQIVDSITDMALACFKRYVGLYEISDNRSWAMQGTQDRTIGKEFAAGLQTVGWYAPLSYCAAAVNLVYKQAFAQAKRDFTKLDKILTLGVLDSYNRAGDAGLTTKDPQPGYIGCMRHGSTGLGHMWMLRGVQGNTLLTREANTTPAPSDPDQDRNGGCVTDKTREFSFSRTSGLWLMGFIKVT